MWQVCECVIDTKAITSTGTSPEVHASIACLLFKLYEDYVWVSLGNAMKEENDKKKNPEVLVLAWLRVKLYCRECISSTARPPCH
jgi:hypothetical protein